MLNIRWSGLLTISYSPSSRTVWCSGIRNLKEIMDMHVCLVAHSCPALCNPVNCSPPGSSICGISQARTLECIAILFSRGFSWPRDGTQVSYIGKWIFYCWASREAGMYGWLKANLSVTIVSSWVLLVVTDSSQASFDIRRIDTQVFHPCFSFLRN